MGVRLRRVVEEPIHDEYPNSEGYIYRMVARGGELAHEARVHYGETVMLGLVVPLVGETGLQLQALLVPEMFPDIALEKPDEPCYLRLASERLARLDELADPSQKIAVLIVYFLDAGQHVLS